NRDPRAHVCFTGRGAATFVAFRDVLRLTFVLAAILRLVSAWHDFDLPSEGNGERNTTEWSERSLTAVYVNQPPPHSQVMCQSAETSFSIAGPSDCVPWVASLTNTDELNRIAGYR